MSFESLVYGYIDSITWRKDDYRKYQGRNLEVDDDMLAWLAKFSGLLTRLYWYSAAAHVMTEANGVYRFEWSAHGDVIKTYGRALRMAPPRHNSS